MNSFSFEGISFEMAPLWEMGGPRRSNELDARLNSAHTSLKSKFRSGSVGFYDYPDQVQGADLEKIVKTATRFRENFEGAVCFGIGGSHLGPAAIQEALIGPEKSQKFPVRWVSTIDPRSIDETEHFLKSGKRGAVVISKSGDTTETMGGFFHLSSHFKNEGIVAITDPLSGSLRRISTREKWESFEVPPNIGGRFSVLTPVGLFPTALNGLSPERLLQGARKMRGLLEKTDPRENPAYAMAAAFHGWDTGFKHNVHVFMPYSTQLVLFSQWFIQLFGESIGKRTERDPKIATGFTPMAALGTRDQHSLLQLFKEGPRDKVVGFVSVEAPSPKIQKPKFSTGELEFLVGKELGLLSTLASEATETSLRNGGVPTYRLRLKTLNEETLGALFFFFETVCAFAGELYGVNAFNQPGVEEAKRLLKEKL